MRKGLKMAASCLAAALTISCVSLAGISARAAAQDTVVVTNDLQVSYSAQADLPLIGESTDDQTITVTIDADREITWDGIGFKVFYDEPLRLVGISNEEVTLTAADMQIAKGSGVNGAGFQTADSENSTIRNICVLTFTVPANTPAGDYQVGVKQLEITRDYGEIWEKSATVMTTLTVEGDKAHTHNLVCVEEKKATCAQTGNYEYWTCTECKRVFRDMAGTQPSTLAEETIEKLPHSWSEWTEDKAQQVQTRECTVCHKSESRSTDGSQPDPVGPSGIAFTDVAQNAYYFTPVEWAVRNGITAGTAAERFSPDAACTRAQAVVFLWRAAGSPMPYSTEMPFTDVAAGTYYHDAVLWAVENGVTSGTSATTFSPNATCTRGQIVTFLYRALG